MSSPSYVRYLLFACIFILREREIRALKCQLIASANDNSIRVCPSPGNVFPSGLVFRYRRLETGQRFRIQVSRFSLKAQWEKVCTLKKLNSLPNFKIIGNHNQTYTPSYEVPQSATSELFGSSLCVEVPKKVENLRIVWTSSFVNPVSSTSVCWSDTQGGNGGRFSCVNANQNFSGSDHDFQVTSSVQSPKGTPLSGTTEGSDTTKTFYYSAFIAMLVLSILLSIIVTVLGLLSYNLYKASKAEKSTYKYNVGLAMANDNHSYRMNDAYDKDISNRRPKLHSSPLPTNKQHHATGKEPGSRFSLKTQPINMTEYDEVQKASQSVLEQAGYEIPFH